MGLGGTDGSELRFAGYVEGLASVIGHKDRIGPLRDYCTGLMLPCERKSVDLRLQVARGYTVGYG